MKKLFNLVTCLVILNSVLYLSGCGLFIKTGQFAKQQLQAQEFYLQYPGELAKVCAQKYPAISSLDTGNWVSTTDTSVRYTIGTGLATPSAIVFGPEPDTVVIRTDTVYAIRTISNTRYRTDTLKVKDVAEADSVKTFIARQNDAVAKLQQLHVDDQAAIAAETHSAMIRLWFCIGFGVLILLLIVIMIEKII